MNEEEKKESGFQVKDRRRFTGEGEQRKADTPPEKAAASGAESAETRQGGSSAKKEAGKVPDDLKRDPSASLPEIDFPTFIVSLSSSVFIHLGLAPDPISGERKRELGLAKQTIDILGMIQEKTRGNLTEEERNLLQGMLYDLRMRYVEEAKKK